MRVKVSTHNSPKRKAIVSCGSQSMKNIYEVLRQKEQLSEQLQKEIDALRLAIKILDAADVPSAAVKPNGSGTIPELPTIAAVNPAKRFP